MILDAPCPYITPMTRGTDIIHRINNRCAPSGDSKFGLNNKLTVFICNRDRPRHMATQYSAIPKWSGVGFENPA
jgi:hypothetical protein